jgi:Fe2+ or Zn2+ uptake regulation protein
MVEVVGATVLADSVVSWAIGKSLDALVVWAKQAVNCKSKCAALAETIGGAQLRAIARDLDSLTQAEAFATLRQQYDSLCEHLEEAQYVVLKCRQTGRWDAVTCARVGARIDTVHTALKATADKLQIKAPAALQQDIHIREQRERDAQAAQDMASLLQQLRPPQQLQPERGPIHRATSLHEPKLMKVFQHMDDLVPRLCEELRAARVHGIVGLPGLGKTTVAAAVSERAKPSFDKHFFLPVGKEADVLGILRGVFQALHPRRQVRTSQVLACAARACHAAGASHVRFQRKGFRVSEFGARRLTTATHQLVCSSR